MAENMSAEMLLRVLNRLPGTAWATRIHPTTNRMEWIYASPRMAELFGVTDEKLGEDPLSLLSQMLPEDAALVEQQLAVSVATLAPLRWIGRVKLPSGALRWIDSESVFERDADGTIVAYGQALDVTAQKQAERIHRAVIDALPVGVIVMDPAGQFLVYNPAADKYAGKAPTGHDGDLSHAFGIFKIDGVTPFPNDRLPLVRATAGEEGVVEEMVIRNAFLDGDCWVHALGKPIRDEFGKLVCGMVSFYDVTTQRQLERELRTRNEALAASEEIKLALIDRLRYAIDELTNPILEVWDDVLVIPVIGVVDSRRTADMVKRLLAEVTRTQASFVIIDLTGVEIVDTKTADHLMKLVRKVELVGARCVLTGIRPAVSETLVDIGVDLGRLTTLRNLKHGLRVALRSARREREGLREIDVDEARPEGAKEAKEAKAGGRSR